MKRFFPLMLVAVLSGTLAAGYPAFETAYLNQSPELAKAKAQLDDARARYLALKDDPYAAPFERAEAEDAFTRARLLLEKTAFELRKAALSTFAAVPIARLEVRQAEARLAVAELAARAAAIRFQRGAIGPSERARAEEDLDAAEFGLAQARRRLARAEATLARYGTFQAMRVPVLTPPAKRAATTHPDDQLARLDLRAARRAYLAARGPDTPRIETDRKAAELAAAEKALEDQEAALEAVLAEREAAWREAGRALVLKTRVVAARRADLAAVRRRYERGAASALDLRQAVLELASAELDQARAQEALARAALELWPFEEAKGP